MKIKELKFRNMCSFGNKLQTLPIGDDPSLVLISGKNGSGKTTIGNTIEFASYGRSARRKIKDLPNRTNKSAYVYINFNTDDDRVIEIERGLSPDMFDLKIDGVPENINKTQANQMIERDLINIPFEVFSNSILLSIKDFKSFIRMTPDDKRRIIDKIFGTDILNSMNVLLKKDIKIENDNLISIQGKIDTQLYTLEQSKNQLEELQKILNEDNKNEKEKLNNELITLQSEFKVLEKDNDDFKTQLITLEEKNKLIKTQLSNELSEKRNSLLSTKQKYNETQNQIFNEFETNKEKEIKVFESQINNKKQEAEDKINTRIEKEKENIKIEFEEKENNTNSKLKIQIQSIETEKKSAIKKEEDLLNKKNLLYTDIMSLSVDIENIKKTIGHYENGKCSECLSDLTSDKSIKKKKQYEKEIIDKNDEHKKKTERLKNIKDEISQVVLEIQKFDNDIKTKNKEITDYVSLYIKLKNEKIDLIRSNFESKLKDGLKAIDNIFLEKRENNSNEVKNKRIELHNNLEENEKTYQETLGILENDYEKDLNNKTEKTNNDISLITEKKEKINSKYYTVKTNIETIEKQLTELNIDKDLVKLKSMKDLIIKIESDLINFKNEKDETEKKLLIYKQTRELLEETGLKKMLMENILPIFNNSIVEMTKELGFKYSFSFDDNFNPIIEHLGEEIPVDTVSTGEEAEMDIIVLLAVLELIKFKHPKINILFLDEIFSSLDPDNIGNVVGILKRFMQQYKMTIFVISHTPVPTEHFDRLITTKYENNFSNFVIT